MIVVDTSVWVGTLIANDVHFLERTAWYDACMVGKVSLHFPLLILPELAGVLARTGIGPVNIAEEIDKIVNRSETRLHPLDFMLSLLASRVASATGIKGADAIFVALAAWLDLPLVTWDKEQRERGTAFCRTMTPAEAMEVAG